LEPIKRDGKESTIYNGVGLGSEIPACDTFNKIFTVPFLSRVKAQTIVIYPKDLSCNISSLRIIDKNQDSAKAHMVAQREFLAKWNCLDTRHFRRTIEFYLQRIINLMKKKVFMNRKDWYFGAESGRQEGPKFLQIL
jgi:hypothetical protein